MVSTYFAIGFFFFFFFYYPSLSNYQCLGRSRRITVLADFVVFLGNGVMHAMLSTAFLSRLRYRGTFSEPSWKGD
jgi:hypothetical protein